MTNFPSNPWGRVGQPAGVNAKPNAPSRQVTHIVRKPFYDGRVLEFIYQQKTEATADMAFNTWELIQPPALDCPCTPLSHEDVVSCYSCNRIVCERRHSRTCQHCGEVFCSACLEGISIRDLQAIVCRKCSSKLTAPKIVKVFSRIKGMIWG